MGDGIPDPLELHEVFSRLVNAFPDGFRYFLGLAHSDTHAAVTVSHYNEDAELETLSAFYNLADTVNGDNAFCKLHPLRIYFFPDHPLRLP